MAVRLTSGGPESHWFYQINPYLRILRPVEACDGGGEAVVEGRSLRLDLYAACDRELNARTDSSAASVIKSATRMTSGMSVLKSMARRFC